MSDYKKNPTGLKNIKNPLPNGIKVLSKKLPLYVGIFLFAAFGVIMYEVMRPAPTEKEVKQEEKNVSKYNDENATTAAIFANHHYKINATDKNQSTNPSIVSPKYDKNVTMPQYESPLDKAAQQAYADQLTRNISAKQAGTSLQNQNQNQSPTQNNPMSAIDGMVNSLKNGLINPADTGKSAVADLLALQNKPSSNINDESNKFMASTKNSYDYLSYKKTPQITKFELKTGSVIPGVMISGVNSELPGMIIGQVSNNVYDSATGKYLLIPQGSRLVGQYSADVQYGQSRVLVAWNRIIFPDGQTLNIEAMNGTDQGGYSGFADKVNNHYAKIFGSALLISIIGGQMTYSNGHIAINQNSGSSSSNQSTVSQVGETMLQKNLAIAPTIEIRPGYQFNIFVTKDMQLEPLKRG